VAGTIIHNYILNPLNLTHLDVVAVTHYDKDHVQGITWILTNAGTNIYDNTIFYDQGRPPRPLRSNYTNYRAAIATKPNSIRATENVNSFDIVNYNANNVAVIPRGMVNGYLDPDWLIGKEILWGNGGDGLFGAPAFASTPPPHVNFPGFVSPNPPTVTCIAANKYVLQVGGGVNYVSNKSIYNGPNRLGNNQIARDENECTNCKSLAFLVQFNNFKYYVGGDIESIQEDGCYNPNSLPNPTQQFGIIEIVNPTNDMNGRVLAMKASHHGSNASTSRGFVNRLRPSAAIISTGQGNQFKHPGQQCVNVLDGYPANPINADQINQNRHPPTPPPASYRPVKYYLTGFQGFDMTTRQWLTYGGDASETAGDPANNIPGHTRIEVSNAQSMLPPVGQVYRGIIAAVNHTQAGTGGVVAAAPIADAGATYGTAAAVWVIMSAALVNNALPGPVLQALDAMAYVGTDANGVGVIAAAIAAAGGGAVPAAAAAAGVGTRALQIGNGVAAAIGAAITGGNAGAISLAATNAVPAASANAARAAGIVGETTFNAAGMTADDAGFAVAAAMGAVKGGATVLQAVAIAAALVITVNIPTAVQAATLVTTAILAADPMARAQAALAGAVASAIYYEGVPADVGAAVEAALNVAAYPNANTHGNNAVPAATIPNNTLFNVRFLIPGNKANVPHTR
jgi:hypothetical protein